MTARHAYLAIACTATMIWIAWALWMVFAP